MSVEVAARVVSGMAPSWVVVKTSGWPSPETWQSFSVTVRGGMYSRTGVPVTTGTGWRAAVAAVRESPPQPPPRARRTTRRSAAVRFKDRTRETGPGAAEKFKQDKGKWAKPA
jgi:hypothetical protein